VQPGAVLAGRYVVEDLLGQEAGSESWRAHDRILARSVVLQLLPSASPQADQMLAAAKQASRVTDSRILQVLDAADDGSLSYIVREWASGQSLDVVLSEGPLSARRATWVLTEVANAMVNAHRMGLPHRRLVPDSVVLTKSSGVKLIGLGTSAALRGAPAGASDAELEDTINLGRLLYACLTARWPGGNWPGLPPAPTEQGRLLRPRQVRAGVPRALDAICDRILSDDSRYGERITTVAEVRDHLALTFAEEGFAAAVAAGSSPLTATPSSSPQADSPPALLVRDGTSTTGEQPRYTDRPAGDRSTLSRAALWLAALVLVVAIALLAYLVRQSGDDATVNSPDTSGAAGSTSGGPDGGSGPGQVLPIAAVRDFDPLPEGSGDEHPELVSLAIDGDPATAWETMAYFDDRQLGAKTGVGLVVDLGEVRDVTAVQVSLLGNSTTLELRAAPQSSDDPPTGSADEYTLLDTVAKAGSEADFTLDSPARTRYLLIWLTALPKVDEGTWRGRVSEIQVFG
jgi:putative peptidoglycan lipid II flippase